jgi:YjbE family integral membrane protein
MDWWIIALIKIMVINIILSGDNAIVIALASKNLPEKQRRLAIFWGAFGAVALRVVLTLIAIQLLKIPFLTALGGILLLWIAFKMVNERHEPKTVDAPDQLKGAILTIILADFIMSLDNVLAITAVAQRNFTLIAIGLIISIPLIIWGSQLILRLLDRYPLFIVIGAAILAFTAGEMLIKDQTLLAVLQVPHTDYLSWIVPVSLAVTVVVFRPSKKS